MFDDAELQLLRASVNCIAVLERMSCGWKLDMRQSTRRALKYRRGEGEILIINHDGRGWWDPLSQAKGDIFDLVQHLDPSLNFGQVRQVLWRLLGKAPSFPGVLREGEGPHHHAADRGALEPPSSVTARFCGVALPDRPASADCRCDRARRWPGCHS